MRILNLYSGIGGNRKLWDLSPEDKVVAVELDEEIAKVYKMFFPNDEVIIGDAHNYLLNHYEEFDFIWSSPPCPTHSKINFSSGGRWRQEYPDMRLYQEIILLETWFKGKWVVENVVSYYKPLIEPQVSGRHYFWANFPISNRDYRTQIRDSVYGKRKAIIREAQIPELSLLHGFSLEGIKLKNKRQVLRNCVLPELGLHIWRCAFKSEGGTRNET